MRHQGVLHTVILEPEAARVILVWRTSLPCHPNGHSLVGTVAWQKRIVNPDSQLPGSAGSEAEE